jgi:endonuclease YncB( thermonuclease family)
MLLPKIPLYHYEAKVYDVVDGDTFKAVVDCGFRITVNHVFRVHGVDTPEIFRPSCDEERKHGLVAKQMVASKILNKSVYIESIKKKAGIYNRWDAHVYFMEEGQFISLRDYIIENDLVKRDSYEK